MKNPYEEGLPREDIVLGRGLMWVFTVVFLVLIVGPPLSRNWADAFGAIEEGEERWVPVVEFFRFGSEEAQNLLKKKKARDPSIAREAPGLRDHFEVFEGKVEGDAWFAEASRAALQDVMVRVMREGNRKTVVGEGGWLLYRPAVDALTGMGPLRAEPKSVADDPTLPSWEGPLEPILAFGKQLEELGVELILVPLPVKPMVMGGDGEVIRHADAERFYEVLRESGIEVLDMANEWVTGESVDDLFLKQDTHWTPRGMEKAADLVAGYLKSRPWYGEVEGDAGRFEFEDASMASVGDLVGNLGLAAGQGIFSEEEVTGRRVLDGETGEVVVLNDHESPIVLLGDSFTNIYRQEDMGWGAGAGFGEHLAARLGMPLDVIARNGQASTGVREALANRAGSAREMRDKKKAVVWTIAARDLFLGESAARETDVEWGEVVFNERAGGDTAAELIKLKGKLDLKSAFPDPATVTYKNAIYAVEYEVMEVKEGEYDDGRVKVFLWAFKDRKLQPSARYEVGAEHELKLVPFDQTPYTSEQQSDDGDFLLVPYWADELVGEEGKEKVPIGFWVAVVGIVGFCGVGRWWEWWGRRSRMRT
ncbi:MAG: hypothetical protein AAGD22_05475 [Verrucomicrobiota bacterium]